MSKIGLKLWNINTEAYLKEAKRLYEEKIFDYIELYVVPDNPDKIKDWKALNIPFDIHAPHFAHKMNLSKKEFEKQNLKFYEEVKAYADELRAEAIIFHGGSGGDYKETARQLKNLNDPRALIENKPYDTLPFVNEPYYVGARFEEIEYIIQETGCGFCLDIGHCVCAANSFNLEPYGHIEKFLSLKPKRVHLSDLDINSNMDKHLNYGLENLDFERLFGILPKDIPVTVETNKKSKANLNDFINDVKFLKDIKRTVG